MVRYPGVRDAGVEVEEAALGGRGGDVHTGAVIHEVPAVCARRLPPNASVSIVRRTVSLFRGAGHSWTDRGRALRVSRDLRRA